VSWTLHDSGWKKERAEQQVRGLKKRGKKAKITSKKVGSKRLYTIWKWV